MKFESLDINPDILKGVRDAEFERCTPIQEQSLPDTLEGKDLIAQSQTGTGKTAVFLITIFNRLLAEGKGPLERPRALVLVPTRELAIQVERDAELLGKHLPMRHVAIYGGVDYERQINPLREGVDLVVATPGRMIDLYKSKALRLDDVEIFIIDEADRMFDMGFAPDVSYIAGRLPKDKPRQTMLFSATIDHNVMRLSERYMKPEAITVEIEPEQITVDKIDQRVVYTSNEEKIRMLLGLLKRPGVDRVIIFTNMKRTAEMVGFKLNGNDVEAEVLTGDVSQSKRQKIIDGMKSGQVRILVATDVAARGLHIEGITHVINYDLPDDAASYVHRIGRTARAGKSGEAWSLVCESHAVNLPEIEKFIEKKIESEWLNDDEIPEDRAGNFRRRRPAGATARGSGKSTPRRTGAGGGGGTRGARGPRSGTGKTDEKKRPGRPPRKRPQEAAGEQKAAPVEEAKGAGEAAEAKAPGGAPAAEGDRKPPRKRSRRRRPSGARAGAQGEEGKGNARGGRRAGGAGGAGGAKTERKASETGGAKEGAKGRRSAGGQAGQGSRRPRGGERGRAQRTHPGRKRVERTGPTRSELEKKVERMTAAAMGKLKTPSESAAAGKKPEPGGKGEGVLKKVLKAFWKK